MNYGNAIKAGTSPELRQPEVHEAIDRLESGLRKIVEVDMYIRNKLDYVSRSGPPQEVEAKSQIRAVGSSIPMVERINQLAELAEGVAAMQSAQLDRLAI